MNKKIIIGAIVGAVVLSGASFFIGTKMAGNNPPNSRSGSFAETQPGAFSGRGGGEGMRPTDRRTDQKEVGFTAGKIIAKDEQSITVSLAEGGSRIIFLTENTPINKNVSVNSAELVVGEQVTVTGRVNQDGSISAQAVQVGDSLARPGL